MSDITTVEAAGNRTGRPIIDVAGKRTRKGTVLTDRLCETPVKKRKKYYDRRTRGLYVSITPAGIATFAVNFTDAAGRPTSRTLGVYHRETFSVAHARYSTQDQADSNSATATHETLPIWASSCSGKIPGQTKPSGKGSCWSEKSGSSLIG